MAPQGGSVGFKNTDTGGDLGASSLDSNGNAAVSWTAPTVPNDTVFNLEADYSGDSDGDQPSTVQFQVLVKGTNHNTQTTNTTVAQCNSGQAIQLSANVQRAS